MARGKRTGKAGKKPEDVLSSHYNTPAATWGSTPAPASTSGDMWGSTPPAAATAAPGWGQEATAAPGWSESVDPMFSTQPQQAPAPKGGKKKRGGRNGRSKKKVTLDSLSSGPIPQQDPSDLGYSVKGSQGFSYQDESSYIIDNGVDERTKRADRNGGGGGGPSSSGMMTDAEFLSRQKILAAYRGRASTFSEDAIAGSSDLTAGGGKAGGAGGAGMTAGKPTFSTHFVNKRGARNPHPNSRVYEDYFTTEMLSAGLKAGFLHSGAIRVIGPRGTGFVNSSGDNDILIKGNVALNRALPGDTVVIALSPIETWPSAGDNIQGIPTYSPERGAGAEVSDSESDSESESEPESAAEGEVAGSWKDISTKDHSKGAMRLMAKYGIKALVPTKTSHLASSLSPGALAAAEEAAETAMRHAMEDVEDGDDRRRAPFKTFSTETDLTVMDAVRMGDAAGRRPIGRVVGVIKRARNPANVIGTVRTMGGGRSAALCPSDRTYPKIYFPRGCESVKSDQELVVGVIDEWTAFQSDPRGRVTRKCGPVGELGAETRAILEAADQKDKHPANCMKGLPPATWTPPESEISRRRDCRDWCIFTIDPDTAKDLDDAVSVESIGGGLFRVGVHIADVSNFVERGSPLDKEAYRRASTIYLVNKAVPMLPARLSEDLCSINPGVERCAFSVVWILTEKGEIRGQWIGRTVIKTCARLGYKHAQLVIDGDVHTKEDFVVHGRGFDIVNPKFNHQDVIDRIHILHKMGAAMRSRRMGAGAVALHNVKLTFQLDKKGAPVSVSRYITKEANHLIEEFMLLANKAVARRLLRTFPVDAMVRSHAPPDPKQMMEAAEMIGKLFGESVTIRGGAAMNAIIKRTMEEMNDGVATVIEGLVTKPMMKAQYVGSARRISALRHFGLAFDCYTHFTSPIRRYPDLVVHRQLSQALILERGTDGYVEGGQDENTPRDLLDLSTPITELIPKPSDADDDPDAFDPEDPTGEKKAAEAGLQLEDITGEGNTNRRVEAGGPVSKKHKDVSKSHVIAEKERRSRAHQEKRGGGKAAKNNRGGTKGAGKGKKKNDDEDGSHDPLPPAIREAVQACLPVKTLTMQQVAEQCNTRKDVAKDSDTKSTNVFFHFFLRNRPAPFYARAVVTRAGHSLRVSLVDLGLQCPVFVRDVKKIVSVTEANEEASDPVYKIMWKPLQKRPRKKKASGESKEKDEAPAPVVPEAETEEEKTETVEEKAETAEEKAAREAALQAKVRTHHTGEDLGARNSDPMAFYEQKVRAWDTILVRVCPSADVSKADYFAEPVDPRVADISLCDVSFCVDVDPMASK